jgi:hypothetical protein
MNELLKQLCSLTNMAYLSLKSINLQFKVTLPVSIRYLSVSIAECGSGMFTSLPSVEHVCLEQSQIGNEEPCEFGRFEERLLISLQVDQSFLRALYIEFCRLSTYTFMRGLVLPLSLECLTLVNRGKWHFEVNAIDPKFFENMQNLISFSIFSHWDSSPLILFLLEKMYITLRIWKLRS